VLHDSVYFTTLKSLDYNVFMTFRFNNNNNNNNSVKIASVYAVIQHAGTKLILDQWLMVMTTTMSLDCG